MKELGYAEGTDSATVNWIISHPEMEIFVAADAHDKAIGVVSMSHRPQLRLKGRVVTIDELVVTQGWRRRGVGRALLQRALERARILAVRRVELVNPGRDASAKRLFEACGFTEVEHGVFRLLSAEGQR